MFFRAVEYIAAANFVRNRTGAFAELCDLHSPGKPGIHVVRYAGRAGQIWQAQGVVQSL